MVLEEKTPEKRGAEFACKTRRGPSVVIEADEILVVVRPGAKKGTKMRRGQGWGYARITLESREKRPATTKRISRNRERQKEIKERPN